MHRIGEKIVAFLDPVEIEPGAMTQLENVSKLPFIFKYIAVMPDCHLGIGATVGSMIATKGAVVTAAVGVDQFCGIVAARTKFTSQHLPDNLKETRHGIERRIPTGFGVNQKIHL